MKPPAAAGAGRRGGGRPRAVSRSLTQFDIELAADGGLAEFLVSPRPNDGGRA
jgi:hypothetical protein